MTRSFLAALLPLSIALTGCGRTEYDAAVNETEFVAASPAPMMAMEAPQMERSASKAVRQASQVSGGDIEATQSMIAYRYSYGVSLPAPSVEPVMRSHMQRCLDAGPSRCQVLNASSQDHSEDFSTAYLSIRAEPEWLDEFRSGLDASLADADGRITNSSVSAEDLTRRIFDADARLNAQTALRGRLLNLLETRDAKLQDLLSVERELARVQAEIESATAQLKTLRQRVSMSVTDIRYESRARAVTPSAVSPVVDALRGFLRTLSQGLASVIGFFAMALPWLLFVILPAIAVLRWLLRRKSKPSAD